MAKTNLFNLYLGDAVPADQWCKCQVGPFSVAVNDSYLTDINSLFKNDSIKVNVNWTLSPDDQHPANSPGQVGQFTKSIQRVEGVQGDWVATATAQWSDDNVEQSILSRDPMDDGGIGDLCELLTFLTGRRATYRAIRSQYVRRSGVPFN